MTRALRAAPGLALSVGALAGTLAWYFHEPPKPMPPAAQAGARPTNPVPEPLPSHVALVAALRAARAGGDPWSLARAHGQLASEASAAAERVTRAWMGARDRRTGLIARSLQRHENYASVWNYGDAAADCYGHLVIAAHLVAPDLVPAVREMLDTERRLSGDYPTTYDLKGGKRVVERWRTFGAIEYAKDGLLPILERLGETPWLGRLEEVVDQIWAKGAFPTRTGFVVHKGAEKNGEMLQVLARLYDRTHDPKYLERGRGITDAYVNEVFPESGDLPSFAFDFAAGRVSDRRVRLRDHGNETVAGLVEWTLAERTAPASRFATYAPAIDRMLDRVMESGRRPDGLWLETLGDLRRGLLNDNWGYLSSAYVAWALARPEVDPARERWLDVARTTLRAVSKIPGAPWENGAMDGYADTLEGALYLLQVFDEPEARDWVDGEAGRLLAYQARRTDGFVDKRYLDGNFIRTALLYSQWHSAGILPGPWRADVRVGAERRGDDLFVTVEADRDWSGTLRFDGPRHREILHLDADMPRLNAWPEWYAVDRTARYEVEAPPAAARAVPGAELRGGLAISTHPGETVRLRVRPAPPPGGAP